MRQAVSVSIAIVVAAGALSSCGADSGEGGSAATIESDRDGFSGTLVDPPLQVAPVALRDTDGNSVRLDRLRSGHATAVFFGFTNCDDVCPTTMADLAAARRAVPPETADKVSLIFITVDPQRDSPPVLRDWLNQFDTDIVGLRGPVDSVHRAERSLYAPESGKAVRDPSDTASGHHMANRDHSDRAGHGNSGYEVNHTGVVYLFGPGGETVIYTGDTTATEYAADFAHILGFS